MMKMKVWGAHGEFCARHQWEVIVATLALLACAASVERGGAARVQRCAGWARACPGLEAEYQAADAVVMTFVRCAALLYAYYQVSNLQKIASKYLLIIAGVFSTFASFIFTSALASLFWSELASIKDAPFLFLLVADVARGARMAKAGWCAGEDQGKRVGQALALLGPSATLDTVLAVLLVGVGGLSGVPRLEHLCTFACLALLVDYLVFVTFYPACLSLVSDFAAGRKEIASDGLFSEAELKPNPVVQRVKMIMAGGLLCVHLTSRWPWSREGGLLEGALRDDAVPSAGDDPLFHSYVKWFSVSADYIVIATLLCALIIKFIFFEEQKNWILDMNDMTVKEVVQSEKPMFSIGEEPAVKADIFTQTEDLVAGDELEWPVLSPSSSAAKLNAKKRSMAECLEIYRAEGECATLSDDEVVMLVEQSHIPLHRLEVALGDPLRGVRLRRRVVATRFHAEAAIGQLSYLNYDYSKVLNACCENVIGYVGIPVGYAGPLVVDGKPYMIPMATTEGALVASTNRGAKAIGARGVTSVVEDVGMTRAPAVRLPNVVRAHECRQWLDNKDNYALIKEAFDSTSRFARLQEVHVGVDGATLYLRFRATTGDAMGMNMVSKGAENSLKLLKNFFPDMEVISLSGNYCSDKKAASINWVKGRGKRVVCETVISGENLRNILKTDAKTVSRCNKIKNLSGSALAGSIGGNNAHAANMVTALFIATGQDPAQNVTSSNCSTSMEPCGEAGEDLYVTCTMPSLEVGTVGGGTVLPAQGACLQLLGVKGAGLRPAENSARLASLICATVLAGELSLMAALVNSDLVKSHMRHNRSAANVQSAAPAPASTATSTSASTLLRVPTS
ncbi:PREDICTED: 3-hydroxy-3-methylglutaryl-coenzyme A reductase [Papilio xuthus]|uniref:3-hydroxy-3-methylglutaryl coenzyme A reductase n=1 Tax=Papilio xuthus TaxID=66420 RepID=A0AAJ6ZP74_PAPXU|nr:PREDICTED: 3-hydroxy-3-methylglutaryl-coenzyme A reductase [Papilio xuthus]XP_013176605.1 PREDICTED: 3-hydroxy-3-methylglutaryl-coenzyme A reductase [Papilio xuthus]